MSNEGEDRTHHGDLSMDPRQARKRLAEEAEAWGGGWKDDEGDGVDGHLVLPVIAGLRRGFVGGPVSIEKRKGGCRISFRVDESDYKVDRASAITLVLGALGALLTLFAPLVPGLWRLVPMGILLSLGTWLFIVARLRNSGPEEFFEELEADGADG